MFGKISIELLEARLSPHAVSQTLRAIVSQPGLDDVTVRQYESVTDIKTGTYKFIFGYWAFPFRSELRGLATGLDRRAALTQLLLTLTKGTAGNRLHVIERA